MRHNLLSLLLVLPFLAQAQQYKVKAVAWSRLEVTHALDSLVDASAQQTLDGYKQKVDSVMEPALGLSRKAMSASRPESLLGNFMADMVVAEATCTGLPRADMGLLNVGGLRADMPDGIVHVGDCYLIAPFENRLVVLELKGSDVLELMRNIASAGGEAVSSSVRIVITQKGELKEATIDGEPIDPKRTYTIATIDYLAEGNDRMEALRRRTNLHDTHVLLRDALIEYVIKTRVIDSQLEGRIRVE